MRRLPLPDPPWVPRAWSLGIAVVVIVLIFTLQLFGGFQRIELKVYDLWLAYQPRKDLPASPVVIVGINDRDIQGALGHSELTDHELAEVLTAMLAAKPLAIGVDLLRDFSIGDGKEELAKVLRENPNIICIERLDHGGEVIAIKAPAALADDPNCDQIGCAEIPEDIDGFIRRAVLFMNRRPKDNLIQPPVPSFALQLAMLALEPEGLMPQRAPDDSHVGLGKSMIRLFQGNDGAYNGAAVSGGQFLLDYKRATFDTFTYGDWKNKKMIADDLRGKVIIFGKTSYSNKDFFNNPILRDMFGVQQHAIAVDQLYRLARGNAQQLRFWPKWAEVLWMCFWSIAGAAVGYSKRPPLQFGLWLVGGLAVLSLTIFAWFWFNWWVPLVPSALAWVSSIGMVTVYFLDREITYKIRLLQLLRQLVSDQVVDYLLGNWRRLIEKGQLVPRDVVATVLFTDMRDFSKITSSMDAKTLMVWLNEYMAAMSQVVVAHNGVINKYIGDAIMVVFGVPFSKIGPADDAQRAVECALRMRAKMGELNALWDMTEKKTAGMRIGICTGSLVAGSLGSARRLEYTVIGDIVNTAARLESHKFDNGEDKDCWAQECRILLAKSTHELLDKRFKTEKVGCIDNLKGIQHTVEVYRVKSYQESLS